MILMNARMDRPRRDQDQAFGGCMNNPLEGGAASDRFAVPSYEYSSELLGRIAVIRQRRLECPTSREISVACTGAKVRQI